MEINRIFVIGALLILFGGCLESLAGNGKELGQEDKWQRYETARARPYGGGQADLKEIIDTFMEAITTPEAAEERRQLGVEWEQTIGPRVERMRDAAVKAELERARQEQKFKGHPIRRGAPARVGQSSKEQLEAQEADLERKLAEVRRQRADLERAQENSSPETVGHGSGGASHAGSNEGLNGRVRTASV